MAGIKDVAPYGVIVHASNGASSCTAGTLIFLLKHHKV